MSHSFNHPLRPQPLRAEARPAEVFSPYLDRIQQSLPDGYVLRLPSEILLGGPGMEPEELNKLIVQVAATQPSPRITIDLLTCQDGPHPCLVGSFTVERADSLPARRELWQHRAMYTPITLAADVTGYLMEGDKIYPPEEYSSVMWEQNSMIYSVRFLVSERQNILYMARSMAIQSPIEVNVETEPEPLPADVISLERSL